MRDSGGVFSPRAQTGRGARSFPRRRDAAARALAVALVRGAAARAFAVALVACALAAGAAQQASDSAAAVRAAQAAPVSVPVELAFTYTGAGEPVPRRFLGLSFEAAALSQLGAYGRHGDLVSLLRSLGPGVLRFGGITSDENVGWTDSATPPPAWATSTIDPGDLRAIATLARRSGWQVLLTVGLAHYEPQAAAREVAAAHAALGPYLAAVEIGNEPEAYANHGYRPAPWLPQEYEEQVSDYREAIEALTPGVRFAGPDVSGSGAFNEWGNAEALSQSPALLTGHHYPLGCAQTPSPSIELLLSPVTRSREARSLETYMAIARQDSIPLRIDEAGTVSCGGVAGISNTFAASLWAAGYIGQTMDAGAAGINLQGNPTNCAGYTPLCATTPAAAASGSLSAEPEWYGLLLTSSLIGYRPLPTTIESSASPNLEASVYWSPGHGLKLLLVDDEPPGSAQLSFSVPVGPGLGPASFLWMTGAAQSSTSSVRLAGRTVPADGAWRQPSRLPRRAPVAGTLTFALSPSSAVLVTVPRTVRRARHASSGRGRVRRQPG